MYDTCAQVLCPQRAKQKASILYKIGPMHAESLQTFAANLWLSNTYCQPETRTSRITPHQDRLLINMAKEFDPARQCRVLYSVLAIHCRKFCTGRCMKACQALVCCTPTWSLVKTLKVYSSTSGAKPGQPPSEPPITPATKVPCPKPSSKVGSWVQFVLSLFIESMTAFTQVA